MAKPDLTKWKVPASVILPGGGYGKLPAMEGYHPMTGATLMTDFMGSEADKHIGVVTGSGWDSAMSRLTGSLRFDPTSQANDLLQANGSNQLNLVSDYKLINWKVRLIPYKLILRELRLEHQFEVLANALQAQGIKAAADGAPEMAFRSVLSWENLGAVDRRNGRPKKGSTTYYWTND